MAQLVSSHAEARILQTAVSLGIFEELQNGPLDARAIASSRRLDLRASQLLLNALVPLGLLEKNGQSFALNETASTYLVRSSPRYFGAMVLFESSLWDCWGALERTVRSGKPPRTPNMYQDDPEETERFIAAMDSLVDARGDARILAEKLDLTGVDAFLDIGSGPGTYPIHLCERYPELHVTIFDLPGTLEITERFVRAAGVENRIRLVSGDYRADPIPAGYQLVFLSNIIHGESSEVNSTLMEKISRSVESGGRIVIKDHILDDSRTHPAAGAIFSLLMLLTTEQGRCYSFNEVKQWLESASFKEVHEITLSHPLTSSLVIGTKK